MDKTYQQQLELFNKNKEELQRNSDALKEFQTYRVGLISEAYRARGADLGFFDIESSLMPIDPTTMIFANNLLMGSVCNLCNPPAKDERPNMLGVNQLTDPFHRFRASLNHNPETARRHGPPIQEAEPLVEVPGEMVRHLNLVNEKYGEFEWIPLDSSCFVLGPYRLISG